METLSMFTTILGAYALAMFIMAALGFALYYFTPYKKAGHFLLAVYFPGRYRIVRMCPYQSGKCRIWNCPRYGKCEEFHNVEEN